MDMRWVRVIALLILILLFTLAHSQEQYKVESLIVKVFQDGVVEIEYVIVPLEYLPTVNISLLGKSFEHITVFNEKKVLLDFNITNDELKVYSLGSEKLTILYATYDLINKTGRLWTLKFKSPVKVTILFPRETAILGLSSIPLAITLSEKEIVVIMREGDVKIDYTFSSLAVKELAMLAIKEAEDLINEVRDKGVNVKDSLSSLNKAKEEYIKGNYGESEKAAKEAINLAKLANLTFIRLQETIKEVKSSAVSKDVLKMIEEAEKLTMQGKYEEAQKIVKEAKMLYKERIWIIAQIEVIGLIIGISVIVASIVLLKKVKKARRERVVRRINLERIFELKPHLRPDDKEVIEYLAEAGGEAFESDIRSRFKLPKTTVWRMIKRLEGEEIVEVRKIRGQNLVRIKDDFTY
jgi:uncharacterized membrane protein